MGVRDARLTEEATQTAEDVAGRLTTLGEVTAKTQFGGNGLYESGTMFAIVDSEGNLFLRATEETAGRFEDRGGHRHGRMPYWSVPSAVVAPDVSLREWAVVALKLARKMKP